MKKTLHVVYKTHLDIGFTDLAENVVTQYLNDFIPKALHLGEVIPDKFIWTTGSWLIDFYLNHPDVSKADKDRMKQAIERGTIRWHGLPFTIHTELMDGTLMEYALSISKKLDKEFNQTTIASKMTDIPGHTISMVPYLASAGIKYLHIGVNASSAIPKVPEIFVWKYSDGSDVIVHYAKDYGDVFEREGWNDALYFAHSHDNMGPPSSAEEVEELFSKLEREYPDYHVIPSTLDAFAQACGEHKSELPIIEEEIADTWIHGVAADPKKIAEYRGLLRLRTKWLEEGKISIDTEHYQAFSDQLLLVAEHTWGANGNVYLPEYKNYLLEDFEKARAKDLVEFNHDRGTMDYGDLMSVVSTDIDWKSMKDRRRYSIYEKSWQEQREYVALAIKALPVELQEEAVTYLYHEQSLPEMKSSVEAITPGKPYVFQNVEVEFSSSGGMSRLVIDGYELIKAGKQFGGLSYERFDFNNYSEFFSQYSRLNRWTTGWAMGDFGRCGIEAVPEIRYESITPFILDSSLVWEADTVTVAFDLSYKESDCNNWGLPRKNTLIYTIDLEKNKIDLSYQWQDKQANRMPEAYWLETSIHTSNPYRWVMEKMDKPVLPFNVLESGNRNMHALSTKGMTYTGYEGRLQIQTKDAPLISLGRKSLLKFDNHIPNLNDGMFINLFNNIWGTNFAAWYEGDMTYHVSFNWDLQEIL